MKPTMLVVDDEPLVRMDIVGMAQEQGYQTVEAASAHQALAILEARDDIRVVLTDIRMPGAMDGIQLAHAVRDRWPPTIIVICSGNMEPAEEDLPLNVAFFSKPVDVTRLATFLAGIQEQLSTRPE